MEKLNNKIWEDPHYEGLTTNQGWLAAVIEDHDLELAEKLQFLLQQDPRIPASDKSTLMIDVAQGVVLLNGYVQDPRSMEYAYRDAMSLDIDIDVVNRIGIKSLLN